MGEWGSKYIEHIHRSQEALSYGDVAFLRKAMLPRIQAMKPKTQSASVRDMEAKQRSKMSCRKLRAMGLLDPSLFPSEEEAVWS